MTTSCTCGGGHQTYGACLRAKNIHHDFNATENRRNERELELYRRARKQGIQPGGTTSTATRFALDRSDYTGVAFDAANPLKGHEYA